jgi:hypothetical protein
MRERFNIAPRHRLKPTPWPAERTGCAVGYLFDGRISGEKRPG